MNVLEFQKQKSKTKLSMVTCYDAWSAKLIAGTSVDSILVGDSLAMVMHGHSTTLPANVAMMELHTQAVARGLAGSNKLLVADLPFISYRQDLKTSVRAAGRMMKAGAHAVKLEGAKGNLEMIAHLVDSGIPVMGHLGLTPQSIHQLGGFKVQGNNPAEFERIHHEAEQLEKAGCFSVVLECVPSALAAKITQDIKIPTIGIGAGPDTDGQVLVLQDMLGLNEGFKPKFLRTFMSGAELMKKALNDYDTEVKKATFPTAKESY
ncbi:MAG: 3-methyl-2-oxobutanoate hydroxymethyltransferase [Bdellovibrionaceae bacterium]|nr:3-methyl-2-oxobutanoate hydroxymethyltransferase [Pseudobdellovibrionaceae bacterium]